MKDDDYFDEFLDHDILSPTESPVNRPSWVSDKNSSSKAYDAIQKLFEIKKRYIRHHGNKVDYLKKSLYQISKTEVAEQAGVRMQAIFHSVNYAAPLKKELDDKNKNLVAAKDAKLERRYSGNRAKKKEVIIEELKSAKARDKAISMATVDEVLELTLERVPLDVKRKLKLV